MFSYVLVATLVAAASANPAILSGRIYDGKTVKIEQYPYQISLELDGSHNCGGSIISPYYVLTAAHCVFDYPVDRLAIRAGSSFIHKGGKVHLVDRGIIHEDYQTTKEGMPLADVALLRVTEPFKFDQTQKAVELFDNHEKVVPESKAVVTGWGLTKNSNLVLPKQLQAVEISVHSREFCDKAYDAFGGVPQHQICAGEAGRGVCSADSGGPLVLNGRQLGIVSWSANGCAASGYPGVYMEVASFRDWINLHSNDEH